MLCDTLDARRRIVYDATSSSIVYGTLVLDKAVLLRSSPIAVVPNFIIVFLAKAGLLDLTLP